MSASLVDRGRAHLTMRQGNAARDRREWAEAARHYQLAVQMDPDRADIWVQLGHMLKESGDLAGADVAYARALELQPAIADTHLQVGHLRKVQGDLEAAAVSYARALALDPCLRDAASELQGLGRCVNRDGHLIPLGDPPRTDSERIADLERAVVELRAQLDRQSLSHDEANYALAERNLELEKSIGALTTVVEHQFEELAKLSADNTARFDATESRMSARDSEIDHAFDGCRQTLAAQAEAIEVRAVEVEERIAALTTVVEHQFEELARVSADTAARFDATETRLSARDAELNQAIEGIRQTLVAVDNNDRELAQSSADLRGMTVTLQEALEAQSRLTTDVEVKLAALAERQGASEEAFGDLGKSAQRHADAISSLELALGAATARLEQHAGALGDLERRADEMIRAHAAFEATRATSQDAVDALRATVDGHAEQLAPLSALVETRLAELASSNRTLAQKGVELERALSSMRLRVERQGQAIDKVGADLDRRSDAFAESSAGLAERSAASELTVRRQMAALAAVHARHTDALAALDSRLAALAAALPMSGEMVSIGQSETPTDALEHRAATVSGLPDRTRRKSVARG